MSALDTFDRVFRERLKSAGFGAGRDATNLFEEQAGSDLQVGALITGLRVKTCERTVAFKGARSLEAQATMDVEWQVYSVSQGRVIARISTHGGYAQPSGELGNIAPIMMGAFGDNVSRLVANDEFRGLVTSPVPSVISNPGTIAFSAPTGPTPIAAAAKSVVVVFAGDGQGSGFLISPDGYVLTNHHVAGGSGRVRVRWADGAETVGEVLRSDVRRDVALIRVDAATRSPLSIRHAAATPGETVFAIGTPLDSKLQNTLTKGIVSANRMEKGLALIQSDVAITHGNSGGPLLDERGQVIGIAESGMEPAGSPVGLNFFIPIDDALRALGLTPAAH